MNFSQALHLIKNGGKVRRAGWNGKGMYIYLMEFGLLNISTITLGMTQLEPCICMYTAQQKYQPGWLASQPDMLADDWEEVNDS
jgi:hypothetical protein